MSKAGERLIQSAKEAVAIANMSESDDDFLKRIQAFRLESSPMMYILNEDWTRFLALARRGAAIPDEPTEAMIEASTNIGNLLAGSDYSINDISAACYRAMLAAALVKP